MKFSLQSPPPTGSESENEENEGQQCLEEAELELKPSPTGNFRWEISHFDPSHILTACSNNEIHPIYSSEAATSEGSVVEQGRTTENQEKDVPGNSSMPAPKKKSRKRTLLKSLQKTAKKSRAVVFTDTDTSEVISHFVSQILTDQCVDSNFLSHHPPLSDHHTKNLFVGIHQ